MTRKTIKGQQNSIDQKDQRPDSYAEAVGEIEGQYGVPPQKKQNQQGQTKKVSVDVLQY